MEQLMLAINQIEARKEVRSPRLYFPGKRIIIIRSSAKTCESAVHPGPAPAGNLSFDPVIL
jgi:hypothetical protein